MSKVTRMIPNTKPIVLQITSRNEQGRAKTANIIYDEDAVDLSDESQSKEFVIVFADPEVLTFKG